jgi:hypothetical protein
MFHAAPADELAEIRSEIERLRSKEAAMEQAILHDPALSLNGRWHRLQIEEQRQAVFDVTLLPASIRSDPRFCREKLVQRVTCLPAGGHLAGRPGWPIRREPQSALH